MPQAVHFEVDSTVPRMTVAQGEERFELPALWLREHCQDADHLDPTTQQRLFDPHQLPDDLALTAAERKDDEGVELAFSDGYRGYYHLPALAAEFDPYDGCPQPQPWTADLDRGQQTFDWPSLDTGQALHAATVAFLRYGFIILREVPTRPEEILTVARTFGNLRETNFGQYFEVYSRPRSNDLAYRPVHLGPHTDNPYREPVPGIQLLHCLVNETSGGWSTLVDSLSVGEQLASEDPEGFAMLSQTPVRFRFVDSTSELVERRPIIRRDAQGRMTGVHYSPRLDYLPLLQGESLQRFHRARRRLGELFTDPRYEIRFPLSAGELMFFDNNRVLHGRTAFDPNEGRRHLQGCYIDPDGPRSLCRTLKERAEGESHPAMSTASGWR
ncbi:TauD/TfdA family dioxygenase [Arhodomonas sp. SL1]|uniref:TauD/TfdA family dioxygenase n=1 Tax=Arhodomonas sp. SL1 TaxID=3425691 RepID=UPI003F8832E1